MSLITFLLLAAGLALLIAGAESLVKGASRIAAALGISPLVIGLTVVSFGTSLPELAVSLQSAFNGQPDIALGNVVGSNIFNVLFILGVAAIITPLVVAQQLVKLDVPIMIVVSILVLLFGLNGSIGNLEGALLFAGLISYTVFLVVKSKRENNEIKEEYAKKFGYSEGRSFKKWIINIGLITAGLAMLIFGSNFLLEAAITIAKAFGLSELVIGLTIVAAGTSLPEVFTSVIAGIRGERDIAVGNVVGSNIFNIFAILGLTSLLVPDGINVSSAALNIDIPVMIVVAGACLPIFFTGNKISRWEGFLFLLYYFVYTGFLILNSTDHEILPFYSTVVLFFLLPLTIITLLVIAARAFLKKRKTQSLHKPFYKPRI